MPMTLADLLAAIQARDYPQSLDPAYTGSCPCWATSVVVDGYQVFLAGRCWRVSQDDETQDVIVSGALPAAQLRQIGEALKAQLDQQEWYRPYRVSVDNRGDA